MFLLSPGLGILHPAWFLLLHQPSHSPSAEGQRTSLFRNTSTNIKQRRKLNTSDDDGDDEKDNDDESYLRDLFVKILSDCGEKTLVS